MSKTPFMPLWVADFLAKTMDLDAKQTGAYMLLLMALWTHGGRLPAESKKLQRIARCGRDWPQIWASIEQYFTTENGEISNRRLSEELQKVATKRLVTSHAGARGGKAKALKNKEAALADATISLKQPEPYTERDTVEAKASPAADAPPEPSAEPPVPTLKDLIWHHGRTILVAAGKPDASARAIIGKWLKLHGEESTLAAIDRCRREEALDPVAFIEGCFRHSRKAAEPKPGDSRILRNGQRQVFQAGNGWMTEHA